MPASVAAANNPDVMLAEDMGRYALDPLGFVIYAFPWDKDPELQLVRLPAPWSLVYRVEYGPDRWACELLERIGVQVRANNFDGRTAVKAIREAIASGHGIGKSAIVAWLVCWIMSTRPYSQGTVTANTALQLRTKTWAQIAKWMKKCVTAHWFDPPTTGMGTMRIQHKQHPEKWFCQAQTCAEENSEAFAGQHAANSTSYYVFDEASNVPDKIWEVADGGLTDGEPMQFAFGNPTQNTGRFKECFTTLRHRWGTQQIDSRDVQITNKAFLDELIADYGIDSDIVKVRVRGLFPAMSAKQYISETDVDAAYGRYLRIEQYGFAAKILTCDPAWEGDDELVIGLRQGLKYDVLRTIGKNDNDLVIGKMIADLEDEHQADAVFIDAGFGTGIVSYGRTIGREWVLVWFGGDSPELGCLNMRAYLWKSMRDWLKAGGAIPNDPVLRGELTSVEIVPRADGITQLEAKKDMKRRGMRSPGRADALAISFAHPVQPKPRSVLPGQPEKGVGAADWRAYDPHANIIGQVR